MKKEHHYTTTIEWTGNKGEGTTTYTSYERSHTLNVKGKEAIAMSSDPNFRGDRTKYNPEELLLASLSSCHMLWYLHLCAEAGVVVLSYEDHAQGTMQETEEGGGHFTFVTLYPRVRVADASMIEKANALHYEASKLCFIANSCNFPVHHEPSITT